MLTELILGLRPANERWRYKVTPSLIGLTQTPNQPCVQYAGVCGIAIHNTHVADVGVFSMHMGIFQYKYAALSGEIS